MGSSFQNSIMSRSMMLIFAIVLLRASIANSVPVKRWIPERYSDNDYGMDSHSTTTGDGTMLTSPNYLSYWSDYFPDHYNGNYFRANQDPSHTMYDPVQQLNNVQQYSYAQTMYPNAYPYPYHGGPPPAPAPSGQYPEAPTGRSLISLNALSQHSKQQPAIFMNSFPQSSISPQQVFVMENQRPVQFSSQQFLPTSMFSQSNQPQIAFMLPTGQSQVSPVSSFDISEFPVIQSSSFGSTENQPFIEIEALDFDSSATREDLRPTSSDKNMELLLSVLSNNKELAHSTGNSKLQKALIQAAKQQQAKKESEIELEQAQQLLEALSVAESQTAHHSHAHSQSRDTQDEVEIQVDEFSPQEDLNVEDFDQQELETIQVDVEETQSHPEKISKKHQKKTQSDNVVVKVLEDQVTDHNAVEDKNVEDEQVKIKIVETEEEQIAEGRAHESGDVYEAGSPLDQVYPGVTMPAQTRPLPTPSSYNPLIQYSGGQQQYQAPASAVTTSPYGLTPAQIYQYLNPPQSVSPYYTQPGSYATSIVPPRYYYPPTSTTPRVTRNSVYSTLPVQYNYVYGGTMFPQFG